jgi:hypothetical protein
MSFQGIFFQGMPFPRNFYFYYKSLRISL